MKLNLKLRKHKQFINLNFLHLRYLNLIQYGADWSQGNDSKLGEGPYYDCNPREFDGTEAQKQLILGGTATMWLVVSPFELHTLSLDMSLELCYWLLEFGHYDGLYDLANIHIMVCEVSRVRVTYWLQSYTVTELHCYLWVGHASLDWIVIQ